MSYKRSLTNDSKWESEYYFLEREKDLLESKIAGLEEEKSKVIEMMEKVSSKNTKISSINFQENEGVEKKPNDKTDLNVTIGKLKMVQIIINFILSKFKNILFYLILYFNFIAYRNFRITC